MCSEAARTQGPKMLYLISRRHNVPYHHRFYKLFVPRQKVLRFLLIGTFNPGWDAANDNNANYFYGQASSLFWCIPPRAFNVNCLINKERKEWEEFCITNNIDLTDRISCVTKAEQNNQKHIYLLTLGFKDDNLYKRINRQFFFNLELTTQQLIQLINDNQQTLRGAR